MGFSPRIDEQPLSMSNAARPAASTRGGVAVKGGRLRARVVVMVVIAVVIAGSGEGIKWRLIARLSPARIPSSHRVPAGSGWDCCPGGR
ncbi:hypothetical protein [Lysobacter gummosus]|uniref:hypothetical protein n=1 Tax=Lysobacter gummosus TaxID=262324 RepID=UPI0036384BC3